ncbi:MAG: hypothetical protein MUF61_02290 [archaeon]|jgi:hypothetical protein|nr:hypothetical protein [archaeon]
MVVDVKKLIAAINPDVYCMASEEKFGEINFIRNKVKEILKEGFEKKDKEVYLKAAEKAKLVESNWMDFDDVYKSPFKLDGLKNPIEQHTFVYETTSSSVEQVYFWLHDYLLNKAEYGEGTKKLIDNFMSSPGSAHFSEMSMKSTRMQEEAMKILGGINQILKTILQTTYDLKEFQIRMEPYKKMESKKPEERKAALLNLKQIWMDQVDIKKGNTSIRALAMTGMAGGTPAPNFVMLIDAFMAVSSLKDIETLDLNERVKRILLQRYQEFEAWLQLSKQELRKRFELEKTYLRSQYNTIQLYMRWAKPYLEAAKSLEQRATATAAMVTAFETSLFELTLISWGEYKIIADVAQGLLPKMFLYKVRKKHVPCVLVEMKFRSIPERTQRGSHIFKGMAEVMFTSFALRDDEINLIEEQVNKSNFGDLVDIMMGSTSGLAQLKDDVELFLEDTSEEKEEKPESRDVNPFAALLSFLIPEKKEKKEEKPKKSEGPAVLEPDIKDLDNVIRSQVAIDARRKCRKFYDSFKKSYGMPAF